MNLSNPIRLLITSGATQEPLDDVRFLGNRSSGQLGCQIALAGAVAGYHVTLLRGNQSMSPPAHPRLTSIPFSSTRDLSAKLCEHWPSHHILVMAGAVSDFTPKGGQTKGKIRRNGEMQIELVPTPDLVATLAKESRTDQQILAFALEDQDALEENAKEKLTRKQVDAIVANPLETMESDSICATIYCKDGRQLSPPEKLTKPAFAKWLIEHLSSIVSAT